MAPTDQKMKNKKFTTGDGNRKTSKNNTQGVKKKRKWVPEGKLFQGNIKEGQGFALKRKQKVQHEYNKMLRKEKKKNPGSKQLYKEEYPEHLRHLYMAEAEKLKNEAWTNRLNRSKLRMKRQDMAEEMDEDDAAAQQSDAAAAAQQSDAAAAAQQSDAAAAQQSDAADPDGEVTGGSELSESVAGKPEPTAASEKESIPMSNRMKKKLLKKTSYQKTKEEFELIREKRRKKKEEYLKNKQQREEAIHRYKQKKMETFQMLSKKTKRGQPNLNLQMEYLLQKIQGTNK